MIVCWSSYSCHRPTSSSANGWGKSDTIFWNALYSITHFVHFYLLHCVLISTGVMSPTRLSARSWMRPIFMQLSVRLHLIPYWTLSTKGSSIKNAIIAYTIELLPMHVPLSTNDPQRTRDRKRFDTPIRCVLSSTRDNPFPPLPSVYRKCRRTRWG